MPENLRSTWRPLEPAAARRDCSRCAGTGWCLEFAAGQSLARRCDCRLLSRSIRLKEEIRIPARCEHCTLDAYAPQTLSQMRALRAARRFVEQYPNVAGGLFIAGGPGVGKTHLAVGILLELASRFREGLLFVDFGTMLEAEECRRASGSPPDRRSASSPGLLVIDDFGNAPATESNVEHVEWLLQSRWNCRRPTILTGGFPAGCSRGAAGDRPPLPGDFLVSSPLGSVRPVHRSGDTPVTTQAFVQALSAPIRARLIGDNRMLLVTGSDFRLEGSRRGEQHLSERSGVTKVA